MRSLWIPTALLLASLTTGCTATRAFMRDEDVAAVQRGETFARSHCAGCHAVGRAGVSPRADAPAFSTLAVRYAADQLIWELEASNAVGHYDMPAVATQPADRQALAAYVLSLRPSAL